MWLSKSAGSERSISCMFEILRLNVAVQMGLVGLSVVFLLYRLLNVYMCCVNNCFVVERCLQSKAEVAI